MMDGFPRFAAHLGETVGLDLANAGPDAQLVDLGFDSLAMAEAVVLLASRGVELPPDLITELRTLGDLHHYATVLSPTGALT
jgi:acyl carrier protein